MKKVGGTSDAFYGLGTIGALVYFITQANTFWEVIVGIFKGLLWPALLIYHALLALHV